MSLIAELEGMKFPDEMVTRFFFKCGLHQRKGRVLELGCGNANNLALFAAYDWECLGLDINAESLSQGRRNFLRLGYPAPMLKHADLNDPIPSFGELDVLLMPSSIYYVHANRGRSIIQELSQTLNPNAYVFCRFRTLQDYRYGKGEPLGQETFRLEISETSEKGCTVAFYDESSMRSVISPFQLDPLSIHVMEFTFDNLGSNSKIINNHDMVIWGRKHSQTSCES